MRTRRPSSACNLRRMLHDVTYAACVTRVRRASRVYDVRHTCTRVWRPSRVCGVRHACAACVTRVRRASRGCGVRHACAASPVRASRVCDVGLTFATCVLILVIFEIKDGKLIVTSMSKC